MKTCVERVLDAHPDALRDQLIPILQEVQERDGYLSEKAVKAIAARLRLPASKIYGVATFYNQFRFRPVGRVHILVCRGTACHVMGSAAVLKALQDELKIKAGETTADGCFSLEEVACIGACGLSPVICVNGEFISKVQAARIGEILARFRDTPATPAGAEPGGKAGKPRKAVKRRG